jgi:poly [ADP-ribose] polymerase
MNQVNLVFVDENNHNKFYNLTDLGNGNFKAEWGRVGSTGQSMDYPIAMWDSKLQSKLGKGYVEIAKIVPVKKTTELKITDPQVKALMNFLMKAAKTTLEASYQVSAGEVTKGQIDEAQGLLNRASRLIKTGRHSQESLNAILKDLYRVIPRRMTDTRKYFLRDDYQATFAMELLQAEQNLLDTLESQSKGNAEKLTLDALGLDIQAASKADRDLIAAKTDFKVTNQKIFKVTNKATEAVFKTGKRTKLLYHGTRNANWLSVLQKGLKIRPSGVQTTGSMFGDALYFANKARKSLGYTSLKGSYWASGSEDIGYLAVFEVNTGKEWNLLKNQSYQSWMSRIDTNRLKREGCDTVYAKGGADLRNDEYVVYDSSRCTIRYLIEVKK